MTMYKIKEYQRQKLKFENSTTRQMETLNDMRDEKENLH